MKQLFLFDATVKQQKPTQKKRGRPHTLTPKKIFCVVEPLKTQKSNQSIIKKYLDEHLENFSLDFSL